MMMHTSEFVAQARDKMAGSGWTKGRLRGEADGGDTYCVLGALRAVWMENLDVEDITATHNKAREAIELKIQEIAGFTDIPEFNDKHNTEHEDVLNVMDKTANGLEEHGD